MASASSSLSALKSGSGNARFNSEAASWDRNPFVHTASTHALEAILARFPTQLSKSNPRWTDLEIGCGTGLLSTLIAPYVQTCVAVDAAEGMIEALKTKTQQSGAPQNITPVAVLLEDPEDPALPPADPNQPDGERMKFDLITSHLVLHHIPDLTSVLRTMLGCLKAGGYVALTDFENFGPEARRFHPRSKMEGVERHGIEPRQMETWLKDAGFVDVEVVRAWTMEKKVEKFEAEFGNKGQGAEDEGEISKFPFVLCLGQRPATT